jgi:hypothetical protein
LFDIINKTRPKNKKIKIVFIPELASAWGYLRYKAYIENLPFDIFCGAASIYEWEPISPQNLILDADYVITQEGGWLAEPHLVDKVRQTTEYFSRHKDRFYLVKQFEIDGETVVLLYKRK